jgi:hypothetical protein
MACYRDSFTFTFPWYCNPLAGNLVTFIYVYITCKAHLNQTYCCLKLFRSLWTVELGHIPFYLTHSWNRGNPTSCHKGERYTTNFPVLPPTVDCSSVGQEISSLDGCFMFIATFIQAYHKTIPWASSTQITNELHVNECMQATYKQVTAQPGKKFLAFYGTREFTTVFTDRWIHSTLCFSKIHFNIILPSILPFSSDIFFPSYFRTSIL